MTDCYYKRGVAPKSINVIRAQYLGFKCRVRHNELLSDSFYSSSGIRLGCVMSPILFLITLDEVQLLTLKTEVNSLISNARKIGKI